MGRERSGLDEKVGFIRSLAARSRAAGPQNGTRALSTCTPAMTHFLATWGSRTSAWRAGRDRHVAQVLGPRALQSKFQGCLTPDEAAYHRNASQGRLWGGLLGRGSGLWPANTASAAFSGMMLLRLRPSESSIMPENAKQTPSESF